MLRNLLLIKFGKRNGRNGKNGIKTCQPNFLFNFINIFAILCFGNIGDIGQNIIAVRPIITHCFLVKMFQNIRNNTRYSFRGSKGFFTVNVPNLGIFNIFLFILIHFYNPSFKRFQSFSTSSSSKNSPLKSSHCLICSLLKTSPCKQPL